MQEALEFDPWSEEECFMLLPEGNHQFFVSDATWHVSQNTGNTSIKLKLVFEKEHGVLYTVFDYLSIKFRKKFKHFCDTTDNTQAYAAGKLTPDDCKGKCGMAWVKRDKGDEKYDPKNFIDDYIKSSSLEEVSKTETFSDDDITF